MVLDIIIIAYALVALFHAVNFDASKLSFSEKAKNFFSALLFPGWWLYSLAKKLVTKKPAPFISITTTTV